MIIQILLSIFLIFAISRVVLQVKSARITWGSFLFWCGLFIFALFGVLDPRITTYVANILGIGRGADVVIYISIVLIFYMLFRLSIAIEDTRREISGLVRKIALRDDKKGIHKTTK